MLEEKGRNILLQNLLDIRRRWVSFVDSDADAGKEASTTVIREGLSIHLSDGICAGDRRIKMLVKIVDQRTVESGDRERKPVSERTQRSFIGGHRRWSTDPEARNPRNQDTLHVDAVKVGRRKVAKRISVKCEVRKPQVGLSETATRGNQKSNWSGC